MFALAAALGLSVVAQELPAAPPATGEKAAGAAQLYQSAFTDYISFREPEVMPWRASNDLVRGAGNTGEHDMGTTGLAPAPVPEKMAAPDKSLSKQKAQPAKSASAAPHQAKKPAELPPHTMDHSKMNHKD
ncbi:hypothetical protein [Massilia glaciei]|uniref:hypothetical protein n=1 Tax=Massilia glaciei TaxID=1524097 RepID=UPI0011B22BDC|nr:hypothetical protein [Massilia glaciei]